MRRSELNLDQPDQMGYADVLQLAGAVLDDLWQGRDPEQPFLAESSLPERNLADDAPPLRRQAVHFEGLVRTLLVAAPALAADPQCMQRDVRAVYRQLIVQAADPKHRLTVLCAH